MSSPADSGDGISAQLEAAIAIHRTGRIDEAEATYRRVLAESPDNPEALHMLGVVHLQRNRLDEAVRLFRQAIACNDEDARYHNNLGTALNGLGRREDAIAAFGHALVRDPHFLTARCNRGTALYETQRYADAASEFSAVLDQDPANRTALTNLGALLMRQNRTAEAEEYFRRGLEDYPDDIGLLCNLGIALERLNQLAEAESVGRRALKANPSAVEPRFLLARLDKRADRLEQARQGLESLLAEPLGLDLTVDVWFELGQVLDRIGAFEGAVTAFGKANSLQATTPEAQIAQGKRFLARVAANRRVFTHDRFPSAVPADPDAAHPPPVFFVGFPRSGTTLMERVLAAHPDVVTTGEDSPLAKLLGSLWNAAGHVPAPGSLTEDDLECGRRTFWSEAEAAHGPIGRRVLVDKMPLNIVDLGYANFFCPDARAIVALRDPRDVCLSCFMQRFRMNDGMRNFVAFEDTVRTYHAVMGLWRHYRETLTIPWLEYRYEDLVEDVEGTVRSVLAFIGLDWHPDIDGYRQHAMEQTIRTPSYRDVTSPVYSRAVGRWRNYRTLFEPHLDVLRPYISAFGYPAD